MSTLTRLTLGRLQAPPGAGTIVGLVDVELVSGALEVEVAEPLAATLDSELSVSISNQELSITVVADPLVVDIAASLTCEVE